LLVVVEEVERIHLLLVVVEVVEEPQVRVPLQVVPQVVLVEHQVPQRVH
jgi:hypothetical protein